jgi:hypothetical protein
MPTVGFEPTISASEGPQTHARDHAIPGVGYRIITRQNVVQRYDAVWTVRGSNLGGGELIHTVHIGPEAHPASCTKGNGLLTRRWSGRVMALTTHPIYR